MSIKDLFLGAAVISMVLMAQGIVRADDYSCTQQVCTETEECTPGGIDGEFDVAGTCEMVQICTDVPACCYPGSDNQTESANGIAW